MIAAVDIMLEAWQRLQGVRDPLFGALADEAAYCLDAPEFMPGGSMVRDDNDGDAFTRHSFAYREPDAQRERAAA